MSARSQNHVDHLIRGHETASFRIRGLLRLIFTVAIVLAVVWTLLFVLAAEWQFDAAAFDGLKAYAKSYLVAKFGRGDADIVVNIRGMGAQYVTPYAFLDANRAWFAAQRDKLETIMLLATLGASLLAAALLHLLHRLGEHKASTDFLRGCRLLEATQLAADIRRSSDGASRFALVGIPFPGNKLMRNIGLFGAMGTGKSVACVDLMTQCVEAGRKALIYDKSGEYTALFYRPGKDYLLNPFDARFCGFDVFAEMREIQDFEQIVQSLITTPPGADGATQFFDDAARALFAEAMRKIWRNSGGMDEQRAFIRSSADEKIAFVAGTHAASFLGGKDSDQTAGVFATLGRATKFLDHLTTGVFSVREWVERDDDSRLFLPSMATLHETVRPFYSMVIAIAVRAALGGPITQSEDRLWLFLDELASLNRLDILHTSLTEGRKYGLVHVVGLQNIAQLRMVFGPDATQTMRSNLQNFLVLRVTDEETQEAISKLLGAEELDETSENLSIGTTSQRDGTGAQASRQERALVMPAEIGLLADCTGFIKMAGPFNPARVSYTYDARLKPAQPAFVPRSDLALRRPAPAAEPGVDGGLKIEIRDL